MQLALIYEPHPASAHFFRVVKDIRSLKSSCDVFDSVSLTASEPTDAYDQVSQQSLLLRIQH